MPSDLAPGFGTLSVHGGEPAEKASDSLVTPVCLTSSYVFESTGELKRFFAGEVDRQEYGRYGNPTVRMAEQKNAALEGSEECVLFSSGMAAVTSSLFATLKAGHHVILTMGIDDGLVRLAVGVEDVADLIADLERALAAV